MKNKIVIYTAIYGDKDYLKKPIKFKGCDYVCFTDDEDMSQDTWNIKTTRDNGKCPRRNARNYKVLVHKYFSNYEYSVWVDGTLTPKVNPQELIGKYLHDNDIALFKHPRRDCIYQEMKACKKARRDDASIMQKQINRYRQESYPAHNGLVASGIIIRRHNSSIVIKSMESWWGEIERGSVRDQLSFNYVAHNHNLRYSIIPGNIFCNNFFKHVKHKK